jgi:hypothetical protein
MNTPGPGAASTMSVARPNSAAHLDGSELDRRLPVVHRGRLIRQSRRNDAVALRLLGDPLDRLHPFLRIAPVGDELAV